MAVRNESVRLSLDDQFTTGMARAAAATAVLSHELHNLDGTNVDAGNGLRDTEKAVRDLDTTSRRSGPNIDHYSGRLALLGDAALVGVPALTTLGAAAIPAVTAALAGLGAAAGGIGVTVLALHGVGKAIEAVSAYNLDPTVENLKKMHEALKTLNPDAREFTQFIADLEPQLKNLQAIAQAGMFPGLEAGISDLLTRLPLVEVVVNRLSHAMGDLAAGAGKELAGPDFNAFFEYLKTDAAPTLKEFATATGNVVETVANLFVAFAPLNRSFTGGLVEATQALANWSKGLDKNDSFQSFLAYIRENGPRAVALLGSLTNTFASILEAAAPIGHNLLPVLTTLSNILGAIARSDFGTPLLAGVLAMRALSRAAQGLDAMQLALRRMGLSAETSGGQLRQLGSAAVGLAVLETVGATVGALQGHFDRAVPSTEALTKAILNLNSASAVAQLNDDIGNLGDAVDRLNAGGLTGVANSLDGIANSGGLAGNAIRGFGFITGTQVGIDKGSKDLREYQASVAAVDAALANIATTGSPEQAKAAFASLAAAQGLSKDQQAGLLKLLPQYNDALAASANQATLTGGAIDGLTGSVTSNKSAQQQLTSAINQANQAMKAQRDAALSAFDAETQYRQAVKDAAAQAAKSNAGIRGSSAAALENRQQISGLAAAWNNQSAAVKNNVEKFKDARANFIKTAEAMGVPAAAAKALAKRLLDIPRSTVAHVTADTAQALSAIRGVKAALSSLPRSISVAVNEVTHGAFATGGYTGPGSKYEIAGVVHREELVLPREIVKRDLSMLKARYGGLPGFAGGGLVGSARVPASGSTSPSLTLDLAPGLLAASDGLKSLKAQLDAVNKAYDKQKSALEALRSTMTELSSTVAARFAVDLSPTSPTSNGASVADLVNAGVDYATAQAMFAGQNPAAPSALSQIATETAAATQYTGYIRQLKKWGLSGPALAQMVSELSPEDLAAIIEAGPRAAHQYQAALNGLYSAQATVGHVAAQSAYGAQESAMAKAQRATHAELVGLRADIKAEQKQAHQDATKDGPQATGEAVAGALNGAAHPGKRSR